MGEKKQMQTRVITTVSLLIMNANQLPLHYRFFVPLQVNFRKHYCTCMLLRVDSILRLNQYLQKKKLTLTNTKDEDGGGREAKYGCTSMKIVKFYIFDSWYHTTSNRIRSNQFRSSHFRGNKQSKNEHQIHSL